MSNFGAGLICGLLLGGAMALGSIIDMEHQIVAHHAAAYNATTEEFEWIR